MHQVTQREREIQMSETNFNFYFKVKLYKGEINVYVSLNAYVLLLSVTDFLAPNKKELNIFFKW